MLLRLRDHRSKWLSNKLLIYNYVLNPASTYGLEVWGSTKSSNSLPLQIHQSKILRKIKNPLLWSKRLSVLNLSTLHYRSFHKSQYDHYNQAVQLLFPKHPWQSYQTTEETVAERPNAILFMYSYIMKAWAKVHIYVYISVCVYECVFLYVLCIYECMYFCLYLLQGFFIV